MASETTPPNTASPRRHARHLAVPRGLEDKIYVSQRKRRPVHKVKLQLEGDGICVINFDRPGSSANLFDEQTLRELLGYLRWIKQRSADLHGLVITSAKHTIFIAGADIESVLLAENPLQRESLIELGQEVFNELADLDIPTVAMIHGACLGGGLELALACDYRIASDGRATKIGLPETQLGILPAWGGSTRLPRLIGLPGALRMILTGKHFAARHAKKLGLVDAVVARENLHKQALLCIGSGKRRRPSWRVKLVNLWPVAAWIRRRAYRDVMRKTRGNYPAPVRALDVAVSGLRLRLPEALQLEREAIIDLSQSPEARSLIRSFLLQERAKKTRYPVPASGDLKPIARTAVVGAGVMGAGIAHWISSREIPVTLTDIDDRQLCDGMGRISKAYREGVRHRVFTDLEARRRLDRITPTSRKVPLRRAGLIIEAAVERLDVKRKIFAELESRCAADTLLATNTSALPIAQIADALERPGRMLGLHFFNPVHRMPLVEVVVGPATEPDTVHRALAFVRSIGKLPVVVKDSPGFLVNRILVPYLIEAGRLFDAGVPAVEIDRAMLEFGMPMGPLRLLDEIGNDIALDVAETLSAAFGKRMSAPPVLRLAVARGHLGRKGGGGFYVYGKDGQPEHPAREMALMRDNPATEYLPLAEIQARMVGAMVHEAARCLDEGIVAEPEDVDFAMLAGVGFPPFRGGPLRFADDSGPFDGRRRFYP